MMPQREPDYEAVIVQKLRDMEDLLKSSMASLEEPLQKEWGRAVYVYPPGHGSILQWYKGDYSHVEWGNPLYRFKYLGIPLIEDVLSPATGILRILEEADPTITVGPGYRIAEIEPDVPI